MDIGGLSVRLDRAVKVQQVWCDSLHKTGCACETSVASCESFLRTLPALHGYTSPSVVFSSSHISVVAGFTLLQIYVHTHIWIHFR